MSLAKSFSKGNHVQVRYIIMLIIYLHFVYIPNIMTIYDYYFPQYVDAITIGFPGQFRNFVDQIHVMSIQFRGFGSCTTDSSFDFIFPAFEFASTPIKSKFVSFKFAKRQQVRKTVIQVGRCPDQWRI